LTGSTGFTGFIFPPACSQFNALRVDFQAFNGASGRQAKNYHPLVFNDNYFSLSTTTISTQRMLFSGKDHWGTDAEYEGSYWNVSVIIHY